MTHPWDTINTKPRTIRQQRKKYRRWLGDMRLLKPWYVRWWDEFRYLFMGGPVPRHFEQPGRSNHRWH